MTYISTLPVVQKRNESKNGSQIILTIYAVENGFVYSINCKLCRFIRSYYPTEKETKYPTEKDAQRAAVFRIQSWIKDSRKLKELFSHFVIWYSDNSKSCYSVIMATKIFSSFSQVTADVNRRFLKAGINTVNIVAATARNNAIRNVQCHKAACGSWFDKL